MRANDLITRRVRDRSGAELGRIVDLVTEPDQAGLPVVVAVVVTPHWRGRLLGYNKPQVRGLWLLALGAKLLYHGTREVPWRDIDPHVY